MKEETARKLYRSAKRLGMAGRSCDRDERITVIKTYSGRGMFGRSTFALSVPDVAVLTAVAGGARMKAADREAFVEDLKSLRSDTLGYGVVVY